MNWLTKNLLPLILCVVLGGILWYVYTFNVNIGTVIKWVKDYKPEIKNIEVPKSIPTDLPQIWKPGSVKPAETKPESTPIKPQASTTPKSDEGEIAYIPQLSEESWIRSFEIERMK